MEAVFTNISRALLSRTVLIDLSITDALDQLIESLRTSASLYVVKSRRADEDFFFHFSDFRLLFFALKW